MQKGPHRREHVVVLPRENDLSTSQVGSARANRSGTGAPGGSSFSQRRPHHDPRSAPRGFPLSSSGKRQRESTDEYANGSSPSDEDLNDEDWRPGHVSTVVMCFDSVFHVTSLYRKRNDLDYEGPPDDPDQSLHCYIFAER